MEKLVSGVHHVALKCVGHAEFEKTVAFYRDVLGLEPVRAWGAGDNAGCMLAAGGALIEIFSNATERLEQGAVRHFALATKDADACVAAVRQAGYAITVEPKEVVIGSVPPFPARVAFCIGPVGEEIEFFQEH